METYGPYCSSVEYWRVDSRTPKYSAPPRGSYSALSSGASSS